MSYKQPNGTANSEIFGDKQTDTQTPYCFNAICALYTKLTWPFQYFSQFNENLKQCVFITTKIKRLIKKKTFSFSSKDIQTYRTYGNTFHKN